MKGCENVSEELLHYGIKGMRWGVRRYQNPDGSLTERGKKRVRKEYKREVDKARADVLSKNTKRQTDAYNEAADRMNKGGIDRFNKQQEKKYGKDFANRDGYFDDYQKEFNEAFVSIYNKSLYEAYQGNKHFQRSVELVERYGMVKWDELARTNTMELNELKRLAKQS